MSTILRKVEELFRFKLPDQSAMTKMTEVEQRELKANFMAAIPSEMELAQVQPEERQAVIDKVMQTSAAMPGSIVEEPMPSASSPVLVSQGQFKDGETYNKGSGRALIYKFAEGEHLLRFEDFAVSNGPALHVILASNPTPTKNDDLGTTIDLGSLKGNTGNQNYEIPAGTDLSQYKSIVILCVMFHVVISTATLQ